MKLNPSTKASLTGLATWAAGALINYALQRAFGGKQSIVYAQIDRKLPDVGSVPSRAEQVIEKAIELVQGRPATTLEKTIVRLAYDPVKAAIPILSRT